MLDHLLLGVANLEDGIAHIQNKTGVTPAIGGSHPGLGTHNALLSLGQDLYFEIIAPDPKQDSIMPYMRELPDMTQPGLFTWAAVTTEIDALAARLEQAGYKTSGVNAGSRRRTDGILLEWKTLFTISTFGSVVPFFIQWGETTPHPSQSTPPGCSLLHFEVAHPQGDQLAALFTIMGLDIPIKNASQPGLSAVLQTPNGKTLID